MSSTSSILQFPSETNIISYLTEHPLLSSSSHKCVAVGKPWRFPTRSCFTTLKIIEAAARAFGDQVISSKELKLSAIIAGCLKANTLSWASHLIMMHVVELQIALEDCAKATLSS